MFTWRRITLCVALIALLSAVCLVASCQPAGDGKAPRRTVTEADQAVDELSQDIDLLGTINRLDLKDEQTQPLLALVAKVQDEKAKLEPQRQAAMAELIPLLREKRAALLHDKEVSDELDKKIQDAQGKVDAIEQSLQDASAKYVEDLKKVLSAPQIAIITGADEARSQAEELLQWIRDLPVADYQDEAKSNAQELADPALKLTPEVIMKIFDEARKMTAADYAKNKEAEIAKLAPLYMPMPEAANDALLQFFASPRLGIILQERAAK